MKAAAKELDFERAAAIRDEIRGLREMEIFRSVGVGDRCGDPESCAGVGVGRGSACSRVALHEGLGVRSRAGSLTKIRGRSVGGRPSVRRVEARLDPPPRTAMTTAALPLPTRAVGRQRPRRRPGRRPTGIEQGIAEPHCERGTSCARGVRGQAVQTTARAGQPDAS